MDEIINIQDKLADTCSCGSVKFNLLKSSKIQCHECDNIGDDGIWLNLEATMKHKAAIVGLMALTGDNFQTVVKVLIGMGVAHAKERGLDGEGYLADITD